MKKIILAAAVAGLAVASLSACGSSSSVTDAATGSSATPSSSASPSLMGADPSTWSPTPISMEQNGQVLEFGVGQHAVLMGFTPDVVVSVTNPQVLEVHEATNEDSVVMEPGFVTIGKGSSQVTVTSGGQVVSEFAVDVVGSDLESLEGYSVE